MTEKRWHETVGVIHLHTTYSDGQWDISRIAKVANRQNLDFLVVTDHFSLSLRENGEEGAYGNTMVVAGYETNDDRNWNHYIALDLDEIPNSPISGSDAIKWVNQRGGFGFIAHPDESRHLFTDHPAYPWTDWDIDSYDGIEIWNHISEWLEGLTKWNIPWHYFRPHRSCHGPTKNTLLRWDEANRIRRVVGIGGTDAHGFPYKVILGLTVPVFSYATHFRAIRSHLLMNDPLSLSDLETARRQIFDTIRSGRLFCSYYARGNAQGFEFTFSHADMLATMGDEVEWQGGGTIEVLSPLKANLILIKDSQPVVEVRGKELTHNVTAPGVYRLEAYRKGKGWVYTNPIRILTKSDES